MKIFFTYRSGEVFLIKIKIYTLLKIMHVLFIVGDESLSQPLSLYPGIKI